MHTDTHTHAHTHTHTHTHAHTETAMVQPASGIPASGHGTHFELNTEIVRSRFHILNPPLFLFFPSLSLSQSMVYAARYVNAAQPSGCEGKVGQWLDPLVPDVDVHFNEKRNAFPINVYVQSPRERTPASTTTSLVLRCPPWWEQLNHLQYPMANH